MIDDLSRRKFLEIVTGGAGAAWLASHVEVIEAAAHHAAHLARNPERHAPEFFTADEMRVVEALTARIIPTDDTPGAKEAGCVWFIDRVLARYFPEQRDQFRSGLSDLQREVAQRYPSARDFAALTPEQQDAVLTAIEKTPFFQNACYATITGFVASPDYGGNRDHIGWKVVGHVGGPSYSPPYGYYDQKQNLHRLLGDGGAP